MLPWLHTEGRWIRDSLGREIGIYTPWKPGFEDEPTGWWNPYGGGWYSGLGKWNPEAVKTNLDYMSAWGFTGISLVDIVEWWHFDTDNHKQRIKDIITWADERGLYVVYGQGNAVHYVEGDSGAAYLPYPPYRVNPPIPSERLPEYEAVLPDENAFINNRIDVANELKDFPNVIILLWGEPCAQFTDPTSVSHYWSVAQQAIDGMRATGFKGLIELTFGFDTGLWADVSWAIDQPIVDDNIIYGTMLYCHESWRPSVSIPWYDEWFTYNRLKLNMENARIREAVEVHNLPLICAETGCNVWYKDQEWIREFECFKNQLKILSEWQMPFSLWNWRQGTAFDIFSGDLYTFEPNEVGQSFIDAIPTPISPIEGFIAGVIGLSPLLFTLSLITYKEIT